MPRVWVRGERVVYERDPMLFGVMTVSMVRDRDGLVVCRAYNAPRRDSFDLFTADVLVDAPPLEEKERAEAVTQPGLPGEKK
jgi:hypothetical protein